MSSIGVPSLAHQVRANQIGACCDIASIAVLAYDHLITFKHEVNLIWGTPWNIGKILYFLTRYSIFIESVLLAYYHFTVGKTFSAETCSAIYRTSGWFIFWGVEVAEFILLFRTWAIWDRSPTFGVGLTILLAAFSIPAGVLTRQGLSRVTFTITPVPELQSCFLQAEHDVLIFIDYALILLFETIILILTLIKGVHHYRLSSSSLVVTLYKDGLLYYVYLTFFSIANVLFFVFLVHTGATLILMQRTLHSILTGRILLHLRMAVVHDRRQATNDDVTAILTTILDGSHRDQLTTFMIGAETWFLDSRSSPTSNYDNIDI